MSIIEVMFAILVTVVGLFGAIAVFPAASSMARKGRLNDAAAAAGRSAVRDFDVRGMRQPTRWIGYSQNWNLPQPSPPFPAQNPVPPPNYYFIQNGPIAWPAGTAFCIDPRMIAFYENEYSGKAALPTVRARISLFPAEDRGAIAVVGANPNSVEPRMFRISLFSGNTAAPSALLAKMFPLQADSIFTFDDDLSYERSTDDRSLPATQNYDYIGGTPGNPLARRLAEGHLSWMATLVPKIELVQKFMPGGGSTYMTGQPTDEYVLSIVVFHDREFIPNQFEPTFTDVPAERLVVGQLLSGDGATGGEVQLFANDPRWLKLRANDWVLLAGVHTYSAGGAAVLTNVPAFQWYRVTHCDPEPEQHNPTIPFGNSAYSHTLYATLMGQDWTTSVVNPRFGADSPSRFQATIVDGVVAVYEKTIRLEYGN